jgi:serine protease Do
MFEESYKRRAGITPYIFGGITGISLGLLIVAGFLLYRTSNGTPGEEAARAVQQVQPASLSQRTIEASRSNAIVQATKMVAPTVVSVTATRTVVRVPTFWEDLFFHNWSGSRRRSVGNYGSGVIIKKDGYILTNEHVVRGAERIIVTLTDGESLPAKVVGSADNYDLALLKVDADGLPSAMLGDSDDLMVGEWLIAIGSPYGHLIEDPHPTVTVGVLSAFHRDVKAEASGGRILMDMIQTDAAINPGNSGGPLVNSKGEVIGINTFIFSQSGGSIGIGFAIPINRGKWVLEELVEHGRVRQVYMGMNGTDITPELAIGLDLSDRQGVLVNEIRENGPAQRAGIKPGDMLISINGIPLRDIEHANRVVFGAKVGDELEIEIKRRGDTKKVTLVLEERPNDI